MLVQANGVAKCFLFGNPKHPQSESALIVLSVSFFDKPVNERNLTLLHECIHLRFMSGPLRERVIESERLDRVTTDLTHQAVSGDDLPAVQHWRFDEWDGKGESVEFRLVYDGPLPAQGQSKTRRKEKHRVRRLLHPQLAELWRVHPTLRRIGAMIYNFRSTSWTGIPKTVLQMLPDQYARCGYRFLPLVSQWFNVSCSIDILFLRRDAPGGLVRSGGDIDNRIKVLLDGLKMPTTCDEVDGPPQDGEDPFYCLLEDDQAITTLSVTTDRLLTPLRLDEDPNDVQLVIQVKTILIDTEIAGQLV
jgi:hypothetical protein